MGTDAAVSPVAAARPRARARARVTALPAAWALAGIVAVSALLRFVVSLPHRTATLMPDEYIYWTLARSLAESGRPEIRGAPVYFPAMLEPLVSAPLHLFTTLETAYRLTQAWHAVAMSLAAVPVYLLARRLELKSGYALAAAAAAVAIPGLVYTSSILSEPIGYPLALTTIYVGVRALAAPTARAQAVFLACAGLTAFARIQLVVIPLAFFAGAFVVERWSVRRVVSRFRLSIAACALPVVAVVAVGPARALGYYDEILGNVLDTDALTRSLTRHGLVLAYSAGLALVPGALAAFAAAIARPRDRVEAAFGGIVVALAVMLVAQATLFAANDVAGSTVFKERYLLTLLPLVPVAFGLYVSRGAPWRLGVAAVAAVLLVVSVRVPLSPYATAQNWEDSPFLFALVRGQQLIGVGNTSLVVAFVAAMLLAVATAVAWRVRFAAAAALAATLASGAVLSVAAHSLDHQIVDAHAARFLATDDARWLDHGFGDRAAHLITPRASRGIAFQQVFWNRSIDEVLYMTGAAPIDAFRHSAVSIGRDGSILVDGRAVRRPLVVQQDRSTAVLEGATREFKALNLDYWRPTGTPRLALLAVGRRHDGWTDRPGHISVWPRDGRRLEGTLTLRLSLPVEVERTVVRFRDGTSTRRVVLRGGRPQTLRFSVAANGPWTLRWYAVEPVRLSDSRITGMQMEVPSFRPAPRND